MKNTFSQACLFLGTIVVILFISYSSLYCQTSYPVTSPWAPYDGVLEISKEQREQIMSIQNKFLQETTSLQTKLVTEYAALQSLWNQPSANNAAILAREKSIQESEQKLQERAAQYNVKARSILTPDQLSFLPPGCTLGFLTRQGFGRGYGLGYGRGMGWGMGRGMGRGAGRGMGRGWRVN